MHPRLPGDVEFRAVNADVISTGHVTKNAVDYIRGFRVNEFCAPSAPFWACEVREQTFTLAAMVTGEGNKIALHL
jgi:hypothetical protein